MGDTGDRGLVREMILEISSSLNDSVNLWSSRTWLVLKVVAFVCRFE